MSVGTQFKDLIVEKNTKLADLPKANASTMPFGKLDTDHMLTIDWSSSGGWDKPKISPTKPIELHRFSSVLHYASQCYEGLKAYKNAKG